MGFDPVTMAATISKLKANGQIGYGESKTIINDGSGEMSNIGEFFGAGAYIKVSAEPIPASKITEVTLLMRNNDMEETTIFAKSDLEIMDDEEVPVQLISNISSHEASGVPLVILITADFDVEGIWFYKGTYVFEGKQGITTQRVSAITYGTLHIIDPKYLPVNAINIADYGMGTVFSYVQQALAAGGYYQAWPTVSGFWEKIDEITQSEYNTITLFDNDGTTMRADPMVMLGVTNNLSVNQAITYVPEIGYVQVKGNINRSAVQNVATINVWATILSA